MTIAVATYGDPHWIDLARQRAIPSATAQGVPVVHHHGESLHDARNGALAQVQTEWVIHLDADDELNPGYVETLCHGSDADVRAPAVEYIDTNGWCTRPRIPPVWNHHHVCEAECLQWGNWLVVGSMVPASLVRAVGGWRDYPWSEDWDLWVRCWKYGATFAAVPVAVYRAYARPDSRNRGQTQSERLEAHRLIAVANGLPVP